MIKDCRDCKFCIKAKNINILLYGRTYDECRLIAHSTSLSRKLKGCGLEEAKYFTPKEKLVVRFLKFIGLRRDYE